MKYLSALTKKGLSVENLPKVLQKKIQELDSQLGTLKDIEKLSADKFSDSDLADIEMIKNSIKELDKHIEHKVNIFDQAKYEKKLERIKQFSEIKKNKKEDLVKEEPKSISEPTIDDSKVVEFDHIKEPLVTESVAKDSTQVETTRVDKIMQEQQYDESNYGDSSFDEHYQSSQTRLVEPQYHQATDENEFDRQGDGNPKKMTTGLILMGVGAFFLTWGAVNFFKSRR